MHFNRNKRMKEKTTDLTFIAVMPLNKGLAHGLWDIRYPDGTIRHKGFYLNGNAIGFFCNELIGFGIIEKKFYAR